MVKYMYELPTITAFHLFSIPETQTVARNEFERFIVTYNKETCSNILNLSPPFFLELPKEGPSPQPLSRTALKVLSQALESLAKQNQRPLLQLRLEQNCYLMTAIPQFWFLPHIKMDSYASSSDSTWSYRYWVLIG